MATRKGRSSDELGAANIDDSDPRPAKKRRRKGFSRAKTTPSRRWIWIRRILGVVAMLVIVGVGAVVGVLIYFARDPNLPKIEKLADYHPQQTTRVLDRNGRLIGYLGGPERRTVVPFARISKHLINAVVDAEDPSYFEHQGIDWKGIVRAAVENTLQGRWGRRAQGGSTITQQVVKQLLLSPEKSLRRKVQEVILARQISERLSKEETLAIYLNQANFGHGYYGCQEASRFYFGKDAADLTLAEASFMAGVPQLPERHSPHKNPESAKNRQRYVLGQMVKHGHLDQITADRVAALPIAVRALAAAEPGYAPEALSSAYKVLVEKAGVAALLTLGTTVKTTIDLDLQVAARDSLERGLEDLDRRHGFRGPNGHLQGKALEKHRAALEKSHKDGLRDSQIVVGVIDKVEKGDKPRLLVDVGGQVGFVDLLRETRYAAEGKPAKNAKVVVPVALVDRFHPGDLVRVRSAPERRRADADPKDLPLALELGPQAAMVVMDPQSKEILALVGAYGFRPGGFDRSQRALRQPGSAFKPFLYAAAIDSRKYTAASLVNDSPEVYEKAAGDADWKPQNYEKDTYLGPIRLRQALAHSKNTVAVKLLENLGVPTLIDYANRCGILTPINPESGLSLALGSNSVTPLEMANAYSTLAAGGQWGAAHVVTSIGDDAIVLAPFEERLHPATAFVTVSLLRSVVDEGTAHAAALAIKRPLAGKTGSSNRNSDTIDAWFVGFAPDLLAAVWVGYDDPHSVGRGETGAKAALPIWIDFMTRALAKRPIQDFVQPPGVTTLRIDPKTGQAAAAGVDGIDEVFLDGTAPSETAPSVAGDSDADRLLLERQP